MYCTNLTTLPQLFLQFTRRPSRRDVSKDGGKWTVELFRDWKDRGMLDPQLRHITPPQENCPLEGMKVGTFSVGERSAPSLFHQWACQYAILPSGFQSAHKPIRIMCDAMFFIRF